jgi:hypothetical protein
MSGAPSVNPDPRELSRPEMRQLLRRWRGPSPAGRD